MCTMNIIKGIILFYIVFLFLLCICEYYPVRSRHMTYERYFFSGNSAVHKTANKSIVSESKEWENDSSRNVNHHSSDLLLFFIAARPQLFRDI